MCNVPRTMAGKVGVSSQTSDPRFALLLQSRPVGRYGKELFMCA